VRKRPQWVESGHSLLSLDIHAATPITTLRAIAPIKGDVEKCANRERPERYISTGVLRLARQNVVDDEQPSGERQKDGN
jgi:hypothetical protein